MKPVDPRLLRYARSTRWFLAAVVALGLLGAGLVVAQAVLIADVVVGAFQGGEDVGGLAVPLALLALTAAGRGLVGRLTGLAADRASAAVKSELRGQLLEQTGRLGPGWLAGRRTGELTALATRGIDALDDYFARYLPQLGLAVVVPAVVLARIVTSDWVSALTIALTLPLIPLFMALIGWYTEERTARQWRLLSRLSGHFLDVVAGLPTLKVFGRAKAQAEAVRRITDDYRRATMRTLRIAFLSSFALELLSTLSVALVAVSIGFRLVEGTLDLRTGLLVLVLAPEAYLPLRQVGAQFHAAAEGVAAAEEVFSVLEAPAPPAGRAPAPDLRTTAVEVDSLVVRHPGRTQESLPRTSLTLRPGETVALVGPSGAGKSTLLSALLGFTAPASGRILAGGEDLADIDPEQWRAQIAWVPQHPHLFADTVAANVRLARPGATDEQVRDALRDAGALPFVDELPDGADTVLGEGGAGLSAGQRQRIALARAFLADRPLLLLDEPTANLDGATEQAVVEAVARLAAGRTVLLVVHRPALLAVADRTVTLAPAAAGGTAAPAEPPAGSAPAPAASAAPSPAVPAPAVPGPAAPGLAGPPRAAGDRPLLRLRRTARPLRGRFALGAALGSLALLSAVGLMATSGWLISRASQQPPILYLMVAVTATRAFGIGRSVFRYAERLVTHDAVLRALAGLRADVYRRLERLAPAGLRRTRSGDLLSRLVADVDQLQDYFLRSRLPAVVAVAVSAVSCLLTGLLLPEAGALLALGLLVAGVAVPAVTDAFSRRAEQRLAPARGELATRIVDLLSGTAELTVAGALAGRRDAALRADADLRRIAQRSASSTALGTGLHDLTAGLTVTACALAGVQAVHTGRLDGLLLAVVVLTPLAAFESVAGMPLAAQHRRRSLRAAQRIADVLDAPEPVREPAEPAAAPPSPFPVRLRGITARHPGQSRPALAGIDLDLAPGRRVAVVGASGSGKTTLAHVLLRFLDPEAGSFTLAGRDATALAGDDVRRSIGLCAQDAHLFDSTLRENLRLARPGATDDDLRQVLGRARLLDWVDSLPDGLDTLVGEHGARLSGGQRQRLALARALLADFPVLVLDEPAEHLDLATADALTADLLAATEGRSTLMITHRLAGLEGRVDEVVVLDGGEVVQRGGWDELAAADGPLRRMRERERAADLLPGPR
ncbi:thiol reductant ABC exporter subunit CydD [Streptomyces sp. SCUT-3]|uniref:thiol reductant ABC exporter subunit CydD n=1 Tax=Streptomyces sp. SCUT-3 TaxID=2684469 RepID=UPI0015F8C9DD|nr:thiol reductant ABC exporter subunit CydD [Streptomyces sp. SCUT-3]QMV22558.1 thiol reductant ABC exporter subunit CydD [Streptomyces sp. SCUT-3]